jgi:hypothetical protein
MLPRALRSIWAAVTGQKRPVRKTPELMLHDPSSQRPRDLDDPFIDRDVQLRMAQVIANSVEKKNP